MRAILRLLVTLLVIALVCVGAVWLADRPGGVTIEWLGFRVDTYVSVLAGGIVVLALAIVALIQGLTLIGRAPRALARQRRLRRDRRTERALVRGLVAVAAGDARDAKRQALKVEALSGDSPLALLLAAQAAQIGGDFEAAERAYSLMSKATETRFLGLRGLIVLARRKGDMERALALAAEAQKIRPGAPWVAGELFGLQAAAGEWGQAEKTLTGVLKQKLIGSEEGHRNKAVVLLGRAAQEETADNLREAASFAEKAHRQAPHFVPATVMAARLFAKSARLRKAEKFIEQAWGAEPHPELATTYTEIAGAITPDAAIERLDRLARYNPDHVESRLLVAENAFQRREWAVARAALTAARNSADPDRRILDCLAHLERAEKGDEQAAVRWEQEAQAAPPPARWSCRVCSHTSAAWAPHCPDCKSFDSLEWRHPSVVIEILPRSEAPADGTLDEADV